MVDEIDAYSHAGPAEGVQPASRIAEAALRQIGHRLGAEQVLSHGSALLGAQRPCPMEHGIDHVDPGDIDGRQIDVLGPNRDRFECLDGGIP